MIEPTENAPETPADSPGVEALPAGPPVDEPGAAAGAADAEPAQDADHIRHYAGAGIDERSGIIPRWLLCVYTAMFLWGAYYLYRYWDPAQDGRGRRVPIIDDLLGRFSPWGAPETEPESDRARRSDK